MKVQNYRNVEGQEVVPGVIMRIVAGSDEGAPTFVMRVFEIQPGSAIPAHVHPWEHEMFVITGKGKVKTGGAEIPVSDGDTIMVLPGDTHGLLNTGDTLLQVICVVPLVDGKMPGLPVNN
jgi:quercetin dioxygenase-like cupin family protein